MKKVLIFNPGSFIYGAERGLLNIIKATGKDYDITVVLPARGPLVKLLKQFNVKIKIFPLSVLSYSLSPVYWTMYLLLNIINTVYFAAYIYSRSIDVIYTNSSVIIFPSLVAKILRKKHIWDIREFTSSRFINRIMSLAIKKLSSGIICRSNNIKNILFSMHDSRAKVIYDAIDLDSYAMQSRQKARKLFNIQEGAIVLSIISRIHPLKGQYEFIKLSRSIFEESNNKVILLIAGDITVFNLRNYIYKSKIKRFIDKNNLKNKVIVLGFQEDIANVISATDICIFPFKRNEPFGLSFLEALVFSRDVLVNLNPGFEEISYFFKNKVKELSLATLKQAVSASVVDNRDIYLPSIFSFGVYKAKLLGFIDEVLKS